MAEKLMPYVNGVQYDGSNAVAILAEIPSQQKIDYSIVIVSEASGVAVFSSDSGAGTNNHTLNTSDWLAWEKGEPHVFTDAEIYSLYVKASDLL